MKPSNRRGRRLAIEYALYPSTCSVVKRRDGGHQSDGASEDSAKSKDHTCIDAAHPRLSSRLHLR